MKHPKTDYDSPWKEALDVYFAPFLELFFPQAHADIDWSRGHESLDKELQQIVREAGIGRRFVDMLIKVWLKGGQEQWVLVHIEVQASEDVDFARRMYVYNYCPFDRYNKKVASFAILGDDNPRWRPESYGYRRWGTEVGIRFPVVKLLDYVARRPELEQSSNPFATVVMAHLDTLETRQDQHERKDRKFRLVRSLYERGWDAEQARQLFRVIDWMMDLPKPLKIEVCEQLAQYRREKQMPFITTPEWFGLQQGLSQGIETSLELKFGEAGLRLMPEIREVDEIEKLREILHAIKTAESPEDLRRIWTG